MEQIDQIRKMEMGMFASRRPAAGDLPTFSLQPTTSDVPRQTAAQHSASSEASSLKPSLNETAQTSPSSASPSGYPPSPMGMALPTDAKESRFQSHEMYGRDTKSDFQAGPLSDPHAYGPSHQLNHGYKSPYGMPGPVMSNIHQPGTPLTMFGGMPMPPRSPSSWPNMPPVLGSHPNRGSGTMQYYPMAAQPGPSLGDRLFKCDQCPQSFNRNHDLKRHKRIHLAIKPFPCGDCEKSFSRKDALKRHKLIKPNCGTKINSGLENQKPLEAAQASNASTTSTGTKSLKTMASSQHATWSLDGETKANTGTKKG